MRSPRRWRITAAARATLTTGLREGVPSGGTEGTVLFGPELAVGATLDASGLVAPSVELSGSWTKTGTVRTTAGAVTVAAALGGVTGCPVRIPVGSAAALRPCLLVGSGAFTASSPASTKVEPAFAVSPVGRFDWRLGRFVLGVDGGVSVRPTPEFFFGVPGASSSARVVAYQASRVGGIARLGVTVLLP